jgi:sirohydrochlorin ferrochelatase
VILVGHGSRHLARKGGELDRLADAVRRTGHYRAVMTATLIGAGERPAAALAGLDDGPVLVVPVTMCDGETARAAIPAAFTARPPGTSLPPLIFCPPVGTHPALAGLLAKRAHAAAGRAAATVTTLLLIGHGSARSPASAAATRQQASRLAASGVFREVAVAFLEQPPTLAAVLAQLPGPVIALGLFATCGRHATDDVTSALVAAGRADVRYLGPIGADPALAGVVLAILDAARALIPAGLAGPALPSAAAAVPPSA